MQPWSDCAFYGAIAINKVRYTIYTERCDVAWAYGPCGLGIIWGAIMNIKRQVSC